MSNKIKSSGSTSKLVTTKNTNFKIGVDSGDDYGPTSESGFYNGITPPNGGYTIYVHRNSGGPSIHVANNDTECIFFLKSFGATGNTINEVLNWSTGRTDMWVQTSDLTINDLFITSGLILYFDPSNSLSYPGTGTTITDLSGNGLNGTMSNITFTSPYFTYNGTNSQISISDNALLEVGGDNWTMEVWVNQTNTGNDVVIGKFDSGGLAQDVSYSIRTTGRVYYAQFGDGSGSGSTLYQNSTNYTGTTGNWSQIVYVWKNGATKTLETFVNGLSIGSVSHSLTSLVNTTNNLYIGSYNGGEYAQWFDGKIGITRLYNTALTSSEVLQNYRANKSKYGL